MMIFLQWYNRQSLKFKIAMLSTIVATSAMFIVSVCFIMFETGRFKRDLQNEQLIRLNLVGNSIAAALVFDDTTHVDEALSVFETLPDVQSVIVFTPGGVPTNKYKRTSAKSYLDSLDALPLQTPSSVGYFYKKNHLISQIPIRVDEDIVGVIASETRLDALTRTVLNYLIIATAVIPIVICLAYTLGRFFSQKLTRPIDDLANTMAHVKQTNDYDLRADVGHDNELGRLAENFNEMLMEIRLRDQRLESQTRELLSEKDKAEAASRAKSEFLANMSHELRTPMNGILGMTEVLLRSGLQDNQQQFAEIIYRSGSALTTILNDILDFSKIEADKLDLDLAPFNIKTMVTDVINLLDNKAVSKDIRLIVNFNENLQKMAIGDAGRIRQVLTNIVGNAIKFTNLGAVTVDIRGKTMGERYKLSISVTDTGIGIPQNKLDLVFNKFTQAESSTTRDYGGTGLGLAISRSLIEMMGGKIGVRSEEGNGSTFWFDIILDQHQDKPDALPKQYSGEIHVAVISHNKKNCLALKSKLSSIGMIVSTHDQGTLALKHLKSKVSLKTSNPVIIIEDNKTGIDALSLLDRFRTNAFTKSASYIVLRSDQNENKTRRFERYNNVRTLFAPINLGALMSAINDSLTDSQISGLRGMTGEGKKVSLAQPTSETPAKLPESTEPTLAPAPTLATATRPLTPGKPKTTRVKPRVLVAEDNHINRMVMENMIDLNQYDVTFRNDGKSAVETHQAQPFDIILMDISMPIMNGKQATLAIRSLEKRDNKPSVPIIAVTAHAMKTHRDSYIQAGMNDYLAKPIGQADLQNILHKWSPEEHAAQDTPELRRSA